MAQNSNVISWATAISTNDVSGRKIFFRCVRELSPSFRKSSQPCRIILAWKYESTTGLPRKDVHERMDFLEDCLESQLGQDGLATLALVSTGEDLREWIYYVRSEDEFSKCFTAAIAGLPELPLDIYSADDPEWASYEKFMSSLVINGPEEWI